MSSLASCTPIHAVSGLHLDRTTLGALRSGAFGRLPQHVQAQALAAASVHFVPANSCVHQRADARGGWLGVLSGALRLSTTRRDGRVTTLDVIAPGEFFGHVVSDADGFEEEDVHALTPSRLLVWRSRALRSLMLDEPEFSRFVVHALSLRLQASYQRVAQSMAASLEEKVMTRLLDLSRRVGVEAEGEVRIDLRLSQQAVADMVGCSRQRLNLLFRDLFERGVLRFDRRTRHLFLRRTDSPKRVASDARRHG